MDSGPVAIILWGLLNKGKPACVYEHYLDPLSERTLKSLTEIEQQSRFKLVMRDNRSGETTGFWELDNDLQMADLASSIATAFDADEFGPFDDLAAFVGILNCRREDD